MYDFSNQKFEKHNSYNQLVIIGTYQKDKNIHGIL